MAVETVIGESTVALTGRPKPDVVIMDAVLSSLGGIEATRRISDKAPGFKVIVLTKNLEKPSVVEMLKTGTRGCMLKGKATEELVDAIREVASDLSLCTKTVDKHRQHIMDKLNARGIADLTRYAICEGISPL